MKVLQEYIAGTTEKFYTGLDLCKNNMTGGSSMDFYKRMRHVCARIPYGKVVTYGQIALLCGKPNNARQAGYALHHGLAGKHVPAHRVVNSAGILSGAEAFDTSDMQRLLLEAEGIEVQKTDSGWKVDLKQFGWKHSMKEAEELYEIYREQGI